MRSCIIKNNSLTDAENDNINELVVADNKQNENATLEMNVVYNETDNTLK